MPTGDGTKTVFVKLRDAVGFESTTISDTIYLDTVPPSAPSPPDLDAADDTGTSSSDDLTNRTTNVSFSGSGGVADAAVELVSDLEGTIGSVVADGSGNWTANVDIGAGTHSLTAVAYDSAGNASNPSSALVVVVDVLSSTPTAPDLDASDDSGSADSDDYTNVASNLTFTGAGGEAFAEITVSSDLDGVVGNATADGAGNWTIDGVTLSEGVHSLVSNAIDAAGNNSTDSAPLTLTVDLSAVAPPDPLLSQVDDSGSSDTDGITNQSTNLTFNGGGADPFASITLDSDLDGTIGTTTADASGNWSIDSALTPGSHTITVSSTDLAGNVSGASAGVSIVVDTQAPPSPSVPDLEPADDTGALDTDDITETRTDLTFTGTSSEIGGTVTLSSDIDGALAGGSIDPSGNWSIDVDLSPGTHSITGVVADPAGNTSSASAALTVEIVYVVPTTRPSDFTVTYYWSTGSGVPYTGKLMSYQIRIAPLGSFSQLSRVYWEMPDQDDIFVLYSSDLDGLYELFYNNNMFRSSWSSDPFPPIGGNSDRMEIDSDGIHYGVPTWPIDTTYENNADTAVYDLVPVSLW